MINLFESNNEDLQYIVDNFGREVLINDSSVKAIITNNLVSEYEDKYISSTSPIKRGDLVKDGTVDYLVITESIVKRYSKYKAIMRHCNHEIELPGEEVCVVVGQNEFGEDIVECTTGQPIPVPAIVDNKSFSIQEGAIRLPDNQLLITVQDNEINKNHLVSNYEFELVGSLWKILNVDFTKNGLLLITCELRYEI
jgi:hypothetical protein